MAASTEGRQKVAALGFRKQRPWLSRAQELHVFVQLQRSCSAAMVRGRFCELHRQRITEDEDFGVAYTMRWADPESRGVQQEIEIARNKRKIMKLKTRFKRWRRSFGLLLLYVLLAGWGFCSYYCRINIT